jgi:hypothetical protein
MHRGLLAAIIDELLPVRSGRRWRIQRQTNEKLYRQYCERVEAVNQIPLSYSYVIFTYLPTLYIHHENKTKYCPHCDIVASVSNLIGPLTKQQDWAFWHFEHAPKQEREYLRQKELISHGLTAGVIVCQDFSRFESETGKGCSLCP